MLSWTLMVAHCVRAAIIFLHLARVDLLAYSPCACRRTAEVSPPSIALALVSVGASIRAAAVWSTRIVHTVPDVVALFSVAAEARGARPAAVSIARRSHVIARHASEAWSSRTPIRVNTLDACPRVASIASAAVAPGAFVVARSMHVAVVGFCSIARTDLLACSFSKEIARLACTFVRVRTSVCAAAMASTHYSAIRL